MTDSMADMMTDTGVTDMTADIEVMTIDHMTDMTPMTETDIEAEADTMMGEGEPERILVEGL